MRDKMEVCEIDTNNSIEWDELVNVSASGTIFHSYEWIRCSSRLTGKKYRIIGYMEGGKLIGGCPLYINNTKCYKSASSTVQMTPYAGAIIADMKSSKVKEKEQKYNKIIRSLIKVILEKKYDHIDLINSPNIIDIRPFTLNGWTTNVKYAYYFNLCANIDNSISKDARWIIKKAIKNNISIKKSNDTDIFYKLFVETFLRRGLKPPVSRNFLVNMIDMILAKGIGEMWVAETSSGEIASMEVIIIDNKRAYRWAAASSTDYRELGATSLILYEIFNHLQDKGLKEINLMAANTPKLKEYITSFNPLLYPYYKVSKSNLKYKVLKKICNG